MLSTGLSSVSFVPIRSRPFYKPEDEDEPVDEFYVVTMGPPFRYVIPSFKVLEVGLRQMRIRGDCKGEVVYDLFVRDDPSLNGRICPTMMTLKDYALIPVRFKH